MPAVEKLLVIDSFVLRFCPGEFSRILATSPDARLTSNCGRHRDHHRRNERQGVLWSFGTTLRAVLVVMVVMFFYSVEAGIGWFFGSAVYAAFSCLRASTAA